MNRKLSIKRLELGYILLIGLCMLQQFLILVDLYGDDTFTITKLYFGLSTLAALLLGFTVSGGMAVVLVFIFLVTYFVWLVTYAPIHVISLTWLLILPANILLASFIKSSLIGSRRMLERLEEVKDRQPELDLDTTLGNKEAFADTLTKQINLAKRYSDQYGFCMAMFKIDFLPLVQEYTGSVRFSLLLRHLSGIIQQQIRYEDYKFYMGDGRFVILCPMTDPSYLQTLRNRIRNAMMQGSFLDQRGRELQLIIRGGALVFQRDQFERYEDVDAVIAALDRNTETDLIGEYI
ncbi:GGDEF domain-containing protein [Paenibacillus shirakamiensis]|uniref:GGDEF domain-containing protein n=1 Tax=Paenibacillus shirakamiensis TaxID=1265935 RepID=A0ABS4JLM2_9BACL|nr:diguanylate cyclase [Paenibacillus shirakamiensis]MBP2001991.1 GGDEF domain-containing protein [Paenibacillus shirakamiensis]